MGQVYTAVADCDRPVHVVYVLTDLARTSWVVDKPADGLDQVSKIKKTKGAKMATFVLRVTPEEIQNVSVEKSRSVADHRNPRIADRDPRSGPLERHQGSDTRGRVLSGRNQEGARRPSNCQPTATSP